MIERYGYRMIGICYAILAVACAAILVGAPEYVITLGALPGTLLCLGLIVREALAQI